MGLLSNLTNFVNGAAAKIGGSGIVKGISSFISSQPERIKNVGATIAAAVTGKGVTANTGNKTVDSLLSKAASNPFVTALGGALVKTGIQYAAPAVKKMMSGSSGIVKSGIIKPQSLLTASEVKAAPTNPMVQTLATVRQSGPLTSVTPIVASSGPVQSGMIHNYLSRAPSRSRSRSRSHKRSKSRSHKRSKSRSRKSHKHYGSAKQYARPGGKKVHYTKNGQPYILKANGQARFVKGHRRK